MTEPRCDGLIVLITGATSGLGLHTARWFFARGARLALTCRSMESGRAALQQIASAAPNRAVGHTTAALYELDLCAYDTIVAAAEQLSRDLPRIDVLINNAGMWSTAFEITGDGVERHWAANHLGHFALTNYLLPLLAAAPQARIINVTSGFYTKVDRLPTVKQLLGESHWEWDSRSAYAYSKLANCLHTIALNRKLGAAMRVYAVRPGWVWNTRLGRDHHWLLRWISTPLGIILGRSLSQGIDTIVWCASNQPAPAASGALFADRGTTPYTPYANDVMAEVLWRMSREIEDAVVKRANRLTPQQRENYEAVKRHVDALPDFEPTPGEQDDQEEGEEIAVE